MNQLKKYIIIITKINNIYIYICPDSGTETFE